MLFFLNISYIILKSSNTVRHINIPQHIIDKQVKSNIIFLVNSSIIEFLPQELCREKDANKTFLFLRDKLMKLCEGFWQVDMFVHISVIFILEEAQMWLQIIR